MILKTILIILMCELVVLYTQASLFTKHNVFAQSSVTNIISFGYTQNPTQNQYSLPHAERPTYISIPNAGIRAPIDNGYIKKDGIWKVYMDRLSYAEGLSDINNIFSNIAVYGHATDELLGNLYKVKKGDKIYVFGYDFAYTYKVLSIERIFPDEPDKLLSFGDTNLSIFTCDGETDEQRLLVKSKLINYEKLSQKEVL